MDRETDTKFTLPLDNQNLGVLWGRANMSNEVFHLVRNCPAPVECKNTYQKHDFQLSGFILV